MADLAWAYIGVLFLLVILAWGLYTVTAAGFFIKIIFEPKKLEGKRVALQSRKGLYHEVQNVLMPMLRMLKTDKQIAKSRSLQVQPRHP